MEASAIHGADAMQLTPARWAPPPDAAQPPPMRRRLRFSGQGELRRATTPLWKECSSKTN